MTSAQGETTYRTSFAQEAVWLADQLARSTTAYALPLVLALDGAFDAVALRDALRAVVARHETLRTRIVATEREPIAAIAPQRDIALRVVAASGDASAAAAREVAQLSVEVRADTDGALAATVLAFGADTHVLVIVFHHAMVDGASLDLIAQDVVQFYAAARSGSLANVLPDRGYAEYCGWVRDAEESGAFADGVRWFAERVSGAPRALRLPHAASDVPVAAPGWSMRVLFPEHVALRTEQLAQEEAATPFMVIFALVAGWLQRCTAQDDLVIGVPISWRPDPRFFETVGMFVNTLPFRVQASSDRSVRAILRGSVPDMIDGFAHAGAPFRRIVEAIDPARGGAAIPLIGAILEFTAGPPPSFPYPGGTARVLEPNLAEMIPKLGLALRIRRMDDGLRAELHVDAALTDRATAERLARYLRTFVEAAIEHWDEPIGELAMLSASERADVVDGWNATASDDDTSIPLHELVRGSAARHATAVAVSHDGAELTYRELDDRSDDIAARLASRLGAAERRVVLILERSANLVVLPLAVLKTGAAYIPLDPAYPAGVVAAVLRENGNPLVVADRAAAALLPSGYPNAVLTDEIAALESRPEALRAAHPDDVAYVVYTSGSTGSPKGVEIPHRGIVNNLLWMQANWPLLPTDRLLQKTAFTFDVAVKELFWPLLAGARVVVASDSGYRDPLYVKSVIERERITVTHFVPSMLEVFLSVLGHGEALSLRLVMCGAETLSPALLEAFARASEARLLHLYGPTETSIAVTGWLAPRTGNAGSVPLGPPMSNAQIYVLDSRMRPVPPGVVGELYVGGVPLARGYVARPAETARRFVPNVFGAERTSRLYRTGDFGRYRPDGMLEFAGRADHQVKVRGFRIELEHVEAMLKTHPAVLNAAAVVQRDAAGVARLAAYVTARAGAEPAALRAHARAKLPPYAVPDAVFLIDAFPLLRNGKIDRTALTANDTERARARAAETEPRTPTEAALAATWFEVLGVLPGRDTEFFESGGHSLHAARLASLLRSRLGVDVPLRRVFEHPTVGALAPVIDALLAQRRAPGERTAPVSAAQRRIGVAQSFAQQRMWVLQELLDDDAIYNVSLAFELRGPLDAGRLERALAAVVRRHEALRTALLLAGGIPVQRVTDAALGPLRVIDLTAQGDAAFGAALARVRDDACVPFELNRPPLVRAALYAVGVERHVLALLIHHVAVDDSSALLVKRDLAAFYSGRGAALPAIARTYADFSESQHRSAERGEFAGQLAFWRSRLADLPARPIAFPRPADSPAGAPRGRLLPFAVGAEAAHALRSVAKQHGATTFMAVLAVFAAYLRRFADGDVVVATPAAHRTRDDFEHAAGLFLNTLVLRMDVAPHDAFTAVLERAVSRALEAYENQDVPFELIVQDLRVDRDARVNPLFNVMLVVRTGAGASWELDEVVQARDLTLAAPHAKFDLTLFVEEQDGGFTCSLEYRLDAIGDASAHRHAEGLTRFFEACGEQPERTIAQIEQSGSSAAPDTLVGTGDAAGEPPGARAPNGMLEPAADDDHVLAAVGSAWRSMLAADVGVDENFFLSGGHSVLAARLAARLRETLAVDVRVRDVFDHPTIGSLARSIAPRVRAESVR